jgi:hypothetical protein
MSTLSKVIPQAGSTAVKALILNADLNSIMILNIYCQKQQNDSTVHGNLFGPKNVQTAVVQ